MGTSPLIACRNKLNRQNFTWHCQACGSSDGAWRHAHHKVCGTYALQGASMQARKQLGVSTQSHNKPQHEQTHHHLLPPKTPASTARTVLWLLVFNARQHVSYQSTASTTAIQKVSQRLHPGPGYSRWHTQALCAASV